MKNLIKYIYNSPHKHSVTIKFDDQFGDEDATLKLVNELVEYGLVSKKNGFTGNYSSINVKVEPLLGIVSDKYEFNLDKYLESIKPQLANNTISIGGDVIGAQVAQDSSLGYLKFHHKQKNYPNPTQALPETSIYSTSSLRKLWRKLEMKQIIIGIIVTVIGGGILHFVLY